jgi:hypothetical protein
VILIVPDLRLQQLVTSALLLAQAWPGAWEEVMLLIQVLRMSAPSLAEALKVGLISVLAPAPDLTSAQISLGYGSTILSALAGSETDERVAAPHLRIAEVYRLDITDLTVGGNSALRLAG